MPGGQELGRLPPAVVVVGHHDGALTGADGVQMGQPEDPGRQHDARPVVRVEQRWPLRGSGREHDASGSDANEGAGRWTAATSPPS